MSVLFSRGLKLIDIWFTIKSTVSLGTHAGLHVRADVHKKPFQLGIFHLDTKN